MKLNFSKKQKLILGATAIVIIAAVAFGVWWGIGKNRIKIAQNQVIEAQKSLEEGPKSYEEAVTGLADRKEMTQEENGIMNYGNQGG